MAKFVKLTKWENKTEWDKTTPTNTEELTDAWVNPEQVLIVQVTQCYIPGEKDSYIPKVMVSLGQDIDIIVNESMDETLKILGM